MTSSLGNTSGPRPVIVGICGGTGAGKTTVTEALITRLPAGAATVLSHDAYYRDLGHLKIEDRRIQDFDSIDAFDNALFISHVRRLKSGHAVPAQQFDFETYTTTILETQVPARPVVIVDGILLFALAELLDLLSLRIFVETARDLRFIRRLIRDGESRGRTVESVVKQYLATVRAPDVELIGPLRKHADLIVPNDEWRDTALDFVAAGIAARANL